MGYTSLVGQWWENTYETNTVISIAPRPLATLYDCMKLQCELVDDFLLLRTKRGSRAVRDLLSSNKAAQVYNSFQRPPNFNHHSGQTNLTALSIMQKSDHHHKLFHQTKKNESLSKPAMYFDSLDYG